MSGPLSAIQVMLVDDNPNMRAILISILKGVGVQHICECSDGAAALQRLGQFQADMVIVDYQMSPMDGVEFTRLLRTAPGSPNPYLPVIMITGFAEKHRVIEARDAGVTEFVVKPVTARSVIARLNAVIFKPRPFIKTEHYFGPCRRRRQDPNYQGPWLRESDSGALNSRILG